MWCISVSEYHYSSVFLYINSDVCVDYDIPTSSVTSSTTVSGDVPQWRSQNMCEEVCVPFNQRSIIPQMFYNTQGLLAMGRCSNLCFFFSSVLHYQLLTVRALHNWQSGTVILHSPYKKLFHSGGRQGQGRSLSENKVTCNEAQLWKPYGARTQQTRTSASKII